MSIYKENDQYLHKSLHSLITQSFEDFELIIIDDGMTEENYKTVQGFNDKRFIIHKNEVNLGLTKSLNKAASLAKGSYFARLDSDDWCHPDRLKKQVESFELNNKLVLCGSASLELSPKDGQFLPPKTPLVTEGQDILQKLSSFNPFVHSSLMMTKTAFEFVSGYDPSYRYAQDYNLVLKLSAIGELSNLKEILVYRHLDENNISHKKKKAQSYYALKSRVSAYLKYGGGVNPLLHIVKTLISLVIPNKILLLLKR
jgi:glycosyltransferase involved in cell wall biosynthesis